MNKNQTNAKLFASTPIKKSTVSNGDVDRLQLPTRFLEIFATHFY